MSQYVKEDGKEIQSPDYDKSDVIITCGGGEMMCDVVPYMDFDSIRKSEPKWYMGYSDNTNYTFLSAILADTAAIYGPCAPTFGREPWHESVKDALALLKGEINSVSGYDMWEMDIPHDEEEEEDPIAPYDLNEKTVFQYLLPASGAEEASKSQLISGDDMKDKVTMEGRLLGGCLDILILHIGTKYDKVDEFLEKYKEDGIIWFLESCDLDMLSMRRAFWQMREAGWFKYVKGFLMGRPRHFGEDIFGVNEYTAVADMLGEFGVPVIMDLDIGHLPPSMPIVCGSLAKVEATGNTVKIDYTFK
jgi:muramoyltetrapeptide carboxypeptidase LdcA involved in peptidoglycan recycling